MKEQSIVNFWKLAAEILNNIYQAYQIRWQTFQNNWTLSRQKYEANKYVLQPSATCCHLDNGTWSKISYNQV